MQYMVTFFKWLKIQNSLRTFLELNQFEHENWSDQPIKMEMLQL